MQILNSEEMKYLDKTTIEKYTSGKELMENAANGVVKSLEKNIAKLSDMRVLVVCGPGNNGGDGFAIARLLLNKVVKVEVFFLGDEEKLGEDAKENYNSIKELEINFIEKLSNNYDIVVDAIFGIGLDREVTGKYEDSIKFINKNKFYIVSVDIASGVCCNTGKILNVAIKSDLTVTFHSAKLGHCLYPGRDHCKKLEVIDIGISDEIEFKPTVERKASLKEDIILKKRDKMIHKGIAGKVLIIAGSRGFSGAAYMSAMGALKSGAGMVTLAVPDVINDIIEIKTTEVMTLPLQSNENGTIAYKSYKEIIKFVNKHKINSIVIGPGLRRDKSTIKLILKLIEKLKNQNLILDADAIFALKGNMNIIKNRKNIIITPHYGEYLNLINKKLIDNKLKDVEEFTLENKINVVLKAADTITTNGEKTYINTSGNPGMAVAGMGDVLSGIIASFISQGYDILEAGKMGVFIHGYTGDYLLNFIAEESITPTDIIENLGKVMKSLSKN